MTVESERRPIEEKESFIGKSSWVVIAEIARLNPQIKAFNFASIDSGYYISPSENPLYHNPTPFVEIGINDSAEKLKQTEIGKKVFLETVLEHGILPFAKSAFPTEEWETKKEKEDFILGVTSKVKLEDGSIKHIPMIDFSSSGIGQDVEKAREALILIEQRKGFVLGSGRGMHYYGVDLLSEDEWRGFVGKCLLLNLYDSRVVDHRYFGHRLIDGNCCLRISSHLLKPSVPRILDVFENPNLQT